jgi:hypothetical protein
MTQKQLENEEFENFVILPIGIGAAELQAALEAPELYGAGNVLVSEEAPNVYLVEFTGPFADQPVAPILDISSALGGAARVEVSTQSPGRADGEIVVTAENLGDAVAEGAKSPVKIKDILPAGLQATGIVAAKPLTEAALNISEAVPCDLATLTCEMTKALAPYDQIEVRIAVSVDPGAQTGELNEVHISGGGAQSASIARPITIEAGTPPYGVETYELSNEAEGGGAALQAGSHPFQQTTTIMLNQLEDTEPLESLSGRATNRPEVQPAGLTKDLSFHWPPGLIGNPNPFPQCTAVQFNSRPEDSELINECPEGTAVGVAAVTITTDILSTATLTVPVFNLEPHPGEPARFGFIVEASNTPGFIDTAVRSGEGEDYGVSVSGLNITQIAGVLGVKVTIWGAPGDPRHDNSRGWGCLAATRGFTGQGTCSPAEEAHPPAFVSLPAACNGPQQTSVLGDSWSEPFAFEALPTLATYEMPALKGCNRVPFAPEIESHPSADSGETGSGLDVNVDFDDEGLLNSEGLTQSEANKAIVTLPEGVTINPSVGEGLGVCTPADYKRETLSSQAGEGCPNSSKLGTLHVTTPLVKEAVEGSIYLAQEDDKATTEHGAENPFDSLIALYMVLRNQNLGVLVKLPLKVEPDPKTGQLVATLENIPQLPLAHFNFHFREGARAPLITPAACGTYTTVAKFYPWSNPQVPTTRTADFQVTRGVGGGPCPPGGVPPFHPHFEAGALNNDAGSFSPFNMRLTRADGEQDMTKFSSILPPGELGSLAGVAKCPDSAIALAKSKTGRQELASPSCPANSLIGHTLAGAGVGEALTYVPGQIYLGGPYKGDPLSVISVTPAVAGPFDAGTVVVRLALTLNPKTAEVEVDGANSDPIPHILDGIVLKLRDLRVYVDRKNFTLNPTSCEESSAKAILFGSNLDVFNPADDDPVNLSSRYQASNCASLGYKPKLELNLKGGTKRGGHPGLLATFTPHKGDANTKGLVVRLPRSAFLDQAHIRTICTRVQFAAKACPAGAQYGFIKAWTPLLDEPLEGPVYLRSSNHKLPDLVFDLHGLVDVEVDTRIDSVHGGIRASIESAPDAPLTKVLLRMQGGKKGLIVNSRNLCGSTNKADVEFEGQNGKLSSAKPVMKADCGKARKGNHKRR